MAQSGLNEMSAYLSAFGAKRTSGETAACFGPTRLTQSGHERAAFAAVHDPNLLYLIRDPWAWRHGGVVARRRQRRAACNEKTGP